MRVSVDRVKPGMVLAENIFKNKGDRVPFIIGGTILNERFLFALKQTGIETVKVRISHEVNETIDEELQEMAMESVKNYDIRGTIDSAEKIVAKIMASKYLSYDLSQYTIETSDLYQHSIDVCCFAVSLGKVYNDTKINPKERVNLRDLAVASLLHDVGTLCNDPVKLNHIKLENSLNKTNFPGFNPKCFEAYDKNMSSVYGYAMLKDNLDINTVTRVAVLLQNEDTNGTGALQASREYMSNNSNLSIVMAKMIHVCDMYEMFISKILKDHLGSPSNIIEIMRQLAFSKKIDPELANLFMKNIPLYSVGLKVKLSNGSMGTVAEINEEMLDRPKVEVNGNIIDLLTTTNVVISGICEFNLDRCIASVEDEILEKTR